MVLGIKPRAFCMPGQHSPTKLYLPARSSKAAVFKVPRVMVVPQEPYVKNETLLDDAKYFHFGVGK